MTGEDFMRLADDGCPNCPEHYPTGWRLIVVRDAPLVIPDWVHREYAAGRLKLSVFE
jgi:hypothetical protein